MIYFIDFVDNYTFKYYFSQDFNPLQLPAAHPRRTTPTICDSLAKARTALNSVEHDDAIPSSCSRWQGGAIGGGGAIGAIDGSGGGVVGAEKANSCRVCLLRVPLELDHFLSPSVFAVTVGLPCNGAAAPRVSPRTCNGAVQQSFLTGPVS